jgi:hypothetical protein
MPLDGFKARLDQILSDLARKTDAKSSAPGIYEAMVEIKAAITGLREGLAKTDRELALEQQQLQDAERRGGLAEQIGDAETLELARIWTAKHRERVDLLERKRLVQVDELAYADRQLAEMGEAYRKARLGIPPVGATPVTEPAAPPPDDLTYQIDREAQQALVQQQLAHLKKKLGRND